MDSKEQIVDGLRKENDFLKKENEFLKREFIKLTGAYPTYSYENGNLVLPQINNNRNNNDNKELEIELDKIKEENENLKRAKEISEIQKTNLLNENNILVAKLNNLENVFIGSKLIKNNDGTVKNDYGEDYNTSAVIYYYINI
jgi:kinesin family protein 12